MKWTNWKGSSVLYKLVFTKNAAKEYADLYRRNRAIFKRVRAALLFIMQDPSIGKPMKFDLKGTWSYRVGMYRILYTVERAVLKIYVIDIGHRREVYRRP